MLECGWPDHLMRTFKNGQLQILKLFPQVDEAVAKENGRLGLWRLTMSG